MKGFKLWDLVEIIGGPLGGLKGRIVQQDHLATPVGCGEMWHVQLVESKAVYCLSVASLRLVELPQRTYTLDELLSS